MPNVLLIRPQKESLALAHSLKLKGIQSTIFPLFEPHYLSLPDLGLPQGLIITSKNALYCIQERLDFKQIPLFAVGEQTATLAQKMGFTSVFKGAGTSKDLINVILSNTSPGASLLHLSGERVTGNLVETLKEYGFEARREIVYKIEDASKLPAPLIKILSTEGLTHVMFFSPQTTAVFVDLIKKNKLEATTSFMTSLCLSENVAKKARLIPWKKVWISPEPKAEVMIGHFYEKN